MEALSSRPDLVWPTERVSAPGRGRTGGAEAPLVLDIRNPREVGHKHIDGSVNIPLNHLQGAHGQKSPGIAGLPCIVRGDTGRRSPPASCTSTGSPI
jgi:hypothetical protein